MRVAGTRTYYRPAPPKMPPGLVELMEGLTTEVLKNNPTDIYAFCANHVQHLLQIRDGPPPKNLTLDQKIAKAQEVVRQRAERRRREFDKKIIKAYPMESSDNDITNKPSSSQTANINLPNPVYHELQKSSEVEISHDQINDVPPKKNIPVVQKLIDQQNDKIDSIRNQLTNNDAINTDMEKSSRPSNEKLDDIHKNITADSVKPNTEVEKHDEALVTETEETHFNKDEPQVKENQMIEEKHEHVKENVIEEENSPVVNQELKDTTAICEVSEDFNARKVSDVVNSVIKDNNNKDKLSGLMDETSKADDVQIEVDSQKMSNKSEYKQDLADKEQISNVIDAEPELLQHDNNKPEQEKCENLNNFEQIGNLMSSKNIDTPENEQNDQNGIVKRDSISQMDIHEPIAKTSSVVESQQSYADLPTSDTDYDVEPLVTDDTVNDKEDVQKHIKKDEGYGELPPPPTCAAKTIDDEFHSKDTDNTGGRGDISENPDDKTKAHYQESSNMDLETAAVTIQKVFRNFLFKSRTSTFDDTINEDQSSMDDEDDKNKEECDYVITNALNMNRRPHGINRMDTVLQTVNEEKSLSLSTDDSSTLSSAATIIQAHVRGFLVRNKLNSNKTLSTNSLPASNSNEPSLTSLEADNEHKNKTVLNIHIVPEANNYLSRDESVITSMDLSLDGSPPSSVNLHPLSCDISERRKQLKREDAIQSISPPSNNSGKLSEDVESVKDLLVSDQTKILDHDEVSTTINETNNIVNNISEDIEGKIKTVPVEGENVKNIDNNNKGLSNIEGEIKQVEEDKLKDKRKTLTKMCSDEMDVVTPFFEANPVESKSLMHSGEFHDAVLPTKVSRSDTSVVSEFKNVLVYFFLWNNS